MSEPLDFSSTGTTKSAPPRKPPKPPRMGTGRPKAQVALVVVATVLVVALAGYLMFGRGDGEGGASTAVTTARYCVLADQFDLAVDAALADSPSGAATFRQVGEIVDEMTKTAPSPIRADVAATAKAVREAAGGDAAGIRAASFRERRARIAAYRATACPVGTGSGDG